MIWHATEFDNLSSIIELGLEVRGWDRVTYFANEPHYAAGFLRMRMRRHVLVVGVDEKLLKSELLGIGSDHAAAFYPDDLVVTTYAADIPPDLIDFDSALEFDFRNEDS